MDHHLAVKQQMAERYIFGELSEAERDDFEEHLADCTRCGEDVKAAQIFAANSYAVFREEALAVDTDAVREGSRAPWWRMKWVLAFSGGLNVALAGAALYAFVALVPLLRHEVQTLQAPRVSESFSLAGTTRSARPVYTVPRNGSATFRLDLPEQFDAYTCDIGGGSNDAARKTYNLRIAGSRETLDLTIPVAGLDPGDYNVTIRGLRGGQSQLLSDFVLRVLSPR